MSKKDIKLEITAKTDTGRVRTANEDNFIATQDSSSREWIVPKGDYINSDAGTVLVVSDGMGGLNAGEVASQIAVDSIKEYLSAEFAATQNNKSIRYILEEAIVNAHAEILKHGKQFPDTDGMGCTVVLALIKDDKIHTAWVGDSRCYIWRKGELLQLSKDHSYVQTLVDEGKVTKEQAFYHPESNVITQSLGDHERKPRPDYIAFALSDEDMVMLCSDGLNGMLKDEVLADIITTSTSVSQCVDTLIEEANKEGGVDNITVLMAKVISGINGAGVNGNNGVAVAGDLATIPVALKKKKSYRSLLVALLLLAALGIILFFTVPFFSGAKKIKNTPPKDSLIVKDKAVKNGESLNIAIGKDSVKKLNDSGKSKQKNVVSGKKTEEEALKKQEVKPKPLPPIPNEATRIQKADSTNKEKNQPHEEKQSTNKNKDSI